MSPTNQIRSEDALSTLLFNSENAFGMFMYWKKYIFCRLLSDYWENFMNERCMCSNRWEMNFNQYKSWGQWRFIPLIMSSQLFSFSSLPSQWKFLFHMSNENCSYIYKDICMYGYIASLPSVTLQDTVHKGDQLTSTRFNWDKLEMRSFIDLFEKRMWKTKFCVKFSVYLLVSFVVYSWVLFFIQDLFA